MRRATLILTLAALGAALVIAPAASGATGGAPGFHKQVLLPGSGNGNEPSLAISSSGIRYPSWQSPGEFARSSDGINFVNTGMPDPDALGDVTNAVDASGALYNAQICGGATSLHSCVYRSLDHGNTFPQKTEAADSNPGASDRPWIDVYPHYGPSSSNPDNTTVYLEYHTFSPEDLVYVTVSNDGGKTFGLPTYVTNGTNATTDSGCNTIPSGVTVDQATGTVYALWLSGNDVASNVTTGCNYSQVGPFNKAWVSTSTDGGTTWKAHLAWQGSFDPVTKIGSNADKIFGAISIDKAGEPQVALSVRTQDDPVGYVAACETDPNCQETPQPTNLLLVTSPDAGNHWTKPFKVNSQQGSYFFPSVAAGSAGVVDSIYYHTTSLRPNDPNDQWYTGFAQIRGARATLSSGVARYTTTPTVTRRNLDPNVAHIGGICTFGIFCSAIPNANRNLADAIEVDLDPAGGANAAWTDDTPSHQTQGQDSHIDFTCQSSGASAYSGQPALSGCFRVGS